MQPSLAALLGPCSTRCTKVIEEVVRIDSGQSHLPSYFRSILTFVGRESISMDLRERNRVGGGGMYSKPYEGHCKCYNKPRKLHTHISMDHGYTPSHIKVV
eukprot:COSAG02_NODE_6848_length_3329_cov_1.715480_4_plen_101_part_00